MASIQTISDKDKLRQLFDEDLSVEGSRESLIVPAQIFKQLEEFELNFEPYLSLARTCQLTSFSLYKDPESGRNYLGVLNDGGHATVFFIKPITYEELGDLTFIENLLANFGENLQKGARKYDGKLS